jgi:hypothetical protein
MSELGRIPVVGDTVDVGGGTLSVTRMDGRRVDRICYKPDRGEADHGSIHAGAGSAKTASNKSGNGKSGNGKPGNGMPGNGAKQRIVGSENPEAGSAGPEKADSRKAVRHE